ncbi:hypothetical protein IAT38_006295 [Cryptococcus sp. DSM 104549]
MPLPASQTKHLPLLTHPLPRHPSLHLSLRQISSDSSTSSGSTGTTGTTLWLSAQVLSAYLSSLPLPSPSPPAGAVDSSVVPGAAAEKRLPRVIELGAGIGYTALVLASLGWRVVATDIEPVLSGVLRPNVENGRRALLQGGLSADVEARELDWVAVGGVGVGEDAGEDYRWLREGEGGDREGYDMIVMTDTFYAPHLIDPLWSTLIYLSSPPHRPSSPLPPSSSTSTPSTATPHKSPPIYIALEARDPTLIARALATGKAKGFELKKVGKRVDKEVDRYGWASEDWEGVEVWKAKWKGEGK